MARNASDTVGATAGGGQENRLAGLLRRRNLRLGLRWPRITRARLAVLGVVALLFMWIAVVVSSTTIYSAQVLVVDTGAHGIPPEDSLDFGDLPHGASLERKISFENNGRIPTGVMILEWGSIRDFMSMTDAFFTLDPGEKRSITFDVEPPYSAAAKKYTGKVIVVRVPWWTPW